MIVDRKLYECNVVVIATEVADMNELNLKVLSDDNKVQTELTCQFIEQKQSSPDYQLSYQAKRFRTNKQLHNSSTVKFQVLNWKQVRRKILS